MHRFSLCCLAVSLLLLLPHCRACAQVTLYHDRATFTAALSSLPKTDDYESYPPGEISLGDMRGDFRYTFDADITQPAIVPDGSGGQALGGAPFDVFVGGDSVTFIAGDGSALTAFGADFVYAPAFDTIPAGTYRLGIADGPAVGQFAGSLDTLDPNGGSFFLGLIVTPGFEFAGVNLFSVQTDPDFLVPAYQIDNLIYASVPEPSAMALLGMASAACGIVLLTRRRR